MDHTGNHQISRRILIVLVLIIVTKGRLKRLRGKSSGSRIVAPVDLSSHLLDFFRISGLGHGDSKCDKKRILMVHDSQHLHPWSDVNDTIGEAQERVEDHRQYLERIQQFVVFAGSILGCREEHQGYEPDVGTQIRDRVVRTLRRNGLELLSNYLFLFPIELSVWIGHTAAVVVAAAGVLGVPFFLLVERKLESYDQGHQYGYCTTGDKGPSKHIPEHQPCPITISVTVGRSMERTDTNARIVPKGVQARGDSRNHYRNDHTNYVCQYFGSRTEFLYRRCLRGRRLRFLFPVAVVIVVVCVVDRLNARVKVNGQSGVVHGHRERPKRQEKPDHRAGGRIPERPKDRIVATIDQQRVQPEKDRIDHQCNVEQQDRPLIRRFQLWTRYAHHYDGSEHRQ
mmetsp:Transcript_8491/g.25144  ORF Transcript_8491/g.25144 Transcript_8491/m.25144 type:complete len:397 (-) Transcript_8491:292-1482(-)